MKPSLLRVYELTQLGVVLTYYKNSILLFNPIFIWS